MTYKTITEYGDTIPVCPDGCCIIGRDPIMDRLRNIRRLSRMVEGADDWEFHARIDIDVIASPMFQLKTLDDCAPDFYAQPRIDWLETSADCYPDEMPLFL